MNQSFFKCFSWLLAACLPLTMACGRNLESSAKTYHAKDKHPRKAYRFLSKEARDRLTEGEFARVLRGDDYSEPVSVKALGEESHGERTYGKVALSFVYDTAPPCSVQTTQTWVKENGLWRVLEFPKLRERAAVQLSKGMHAGALQTAEEWLALDPFSIDARVHYHHATEQAGPSGGPHARPGADVIDSMLAINPEDQGALMLATTHSEPVDRAREFFDKIPIDNCNRSNAAFNLSQRFANLQERLDFLDESGASSPLIDVLRILTMDARDGGAEAMQLLKKNARPIRNALTQDPPMGATWAIRLGFFALKNGDEVEAKDWLYFASDLNPLHPQLEPLFHRIFLSRGSSDRPPPTEGNQALDPLQGGETAGGSAPATP